MLPSNDSDEPSGNAPKGVPLPPFVLSSSNDVRERIESATQNLIILIDFVYAVTFSVLVTETISLVLKLQPDEWWEATPKLLLVAICCYFVLWDWILGRLLTLRSSYRTYTPVFCEIVIAVASYGLIASILAGKAYFPFFLFVQQFSGLVWATRMEPYCTRRDAQEFCTIRATQAFGSGLFFLMWIAWIESYPVAVDWSHLLVAGFSILSNIFLYEMWVPRAKGILGGPGFPLLQRKRVRAARIILRAALKKTFAGIGRLRVSSG